MESCPICQESINDSTATVRLGARGCSGVLRANGNKASPVHVIPGDIVHKECRKNFTRPNSSTQNLLHVSKCQSPKRALRSDNETFDFKTRCVFCASKAKVSPIARKRSYDVFPVRTLDFQKTILKHCNVRNDQWSNEIYTRLSNVLDLPAADAVYHQACSVNFRTGKNIPKGYQILEQMGEGKSPGRPENIQQREAFLQIVKHIESSENSSLTISDLEQKMAEICDQKGYSKKHMKKKILEHFGEAVLVSSIDGKNDIITLKQSVSSIIHNFYEQSQEISDEEKKHNIIEAAAKLIKNDINCIPSVKDFYPAFTEVSSAEKNVDYLPASLKNFLEKLVPDKNSVKTASIGQSIMQACRPRGLLVPLQLGLGIQLHHHFGSRFLVDTLNSLGFCCSYREIQKYESNAAAILSTHILHQEADNPFLQFIADNVDHNVRTLDGHNTFHGMGIIATSTPGSDISILVPRKDVTMDEVSALGKVDIKYFIQPHSIPEGIQFQELPVMQPADQCEPLDMLCKFIWPLRRNRPSWSGFMQMFEQTVESFPSKSAITFMPMIDLSPSDASCIFSTLHFVCDQAQRYNKIPVLTFDQPLYQKALDIISSQEPSSPLKTMVLRLGAFHTEMSFLGCIGHLMTGSGLQEVIETIYAPNAVTHMLSGKAIQRAVRGHMLVDNALTVMLLENGVMSPYQVNNKQRYEDYSETIETDSLMTDEVATFDIQQGRSSEAVGADEEMTVESGVEMALEADVEIIWEPGAQMPLEPENFMTNDIANEDFPTELLQDQNLNNLAATYDSLKSDASNYTHLKESDGIQALQTLMKDERQKLAGNRTSKLWIQYMDMVSVLQQFLRAERTGNWQLHLVALRKMLPYFAASGHNLYLKSAYLYLQNMLRLQQTNPDVYMAFVAGFHVIRRSDRYWAGLSTDLLIEQVLMRSVKSTGGLTRGRGMNENQRALWLFSMPICLQMNNAMQEFSNTTYQTSEQHKETGQSRTVRDNKDLSTVLSYLRERNPFGETDTELRNIETGVTADSLVNVDLAEDVGESIVKDMVGKTVGKFSFKRSKQVVRMSEKTETKVLGENVHIDTQLLFQRLTTAANRYVEDVSEIFQYELSSIPSSLFDNSGLPREPQKATLADAIWKQGDCVYIPITDEGAPTCYVIDGGSLLQRLPWAKGSTFGEICKTYLEYLRRHYQKDVTVVFDGYNQGPCTKDITHIRRSKGRVGAMVKFAVETPCRMKKEQFLSNSLNKQNFIFMLAECLLGDGIAVRHATEDADLLIVQTTIEKANISNVTLVGEDTDLLVLLCYYYEAELHDVIFRPVLRKTVAMNRRMWDLRKTKALLGNEMCKCLPLLHAFTGCDTTSRIFGISKPSVMKTFKKSTLFKNLCSDFINATNLDDINRFGELIVIHLYGEPSIMNLNQLRYRKFAGKVVSSTTSVPVQTLPPTSAAARFHSLRVYHQTRVWMGDESLNPVEFGWTIAQGRMVPVTTSLPPAPESLLQAVRCNCKTNCDSKKCTCRKHGLECTSGCGDCKGVSCSNSAIFPQIEDFEH